MSPQKINNDKLTSFLSNPPSPPTHLPSGEGPVAGFRNQSFFLRDWGGGGGGACLTLNREGQVFSGWCVLPLATAFRHYQGHQMKRCDMAFGDGRHFSALRELPSGNSKSHRAL